MSTSLAGETALVIGGTRNIGLAIARALLREGARVYVVGRTDQVALESALAELHASGTPPGGRAGGGAANGGVANSGIAHGEATNVLVAGSLADASDEQAVRSLFDRVEQTLGGPSILVNSAGFRPGGSLEQLELEAWRRVIDVMLTGPFLLARELFRRLPPDRRGAIVNLGGLTAHRPVTGRAHVITAKAGLVGLTRALAEEGRGRIRANCVVPGVIATTRRVGEPAGRHSADAHYAQGSCEDVARAVLYFANPADTYVTGQTLHVSGGRFMP